MGAGLAPSPQQREPVDASFQAVVIEDQQKTRLAGYFRLQPAGDLLSVCGAWLIDTEAKDQLLTDIENGLSYVELGETGLRVQTRLFPTYVPTPIASVPFEAVCQKTAVAWQDDFARLPASVHLIPTVAAPRQNRTPSP